MVELLRCYGCKKPISLSEAIWDRVDGYNMAFCEQCFRSTPLAPDAASPPADDDPGESRGAGEANR